MSCLSHPLLPLVLFVHYLVQRCKTKDVPTGWITNFFFLLAHYDEHLASLLFTLSAHSVRPRVRTGFFCFFTLRRIKEFNDLLLVKISGATFNFCSCSQAAGRTTDGDDGWMLASLNGHKWIQQLEPRGRAAAPSLWSCCWSRSAKDLDHMTGLPTNPLVPFRPKLHPFSLVLRVTQQRAHSFSAVTWPPCRPITLLLLLPGSATIGREMVFFPAAHELNVFNSGCAVCYWRATWSTPPPHKKTSASNNFASGFFIVHLRWVVLAWSADRNLSRDKVVFYWFIMRSSLQSKASTALRRRIVIYWMARVWQENQTENESFIVCAAGQIEMTGGRKLMTWCGRTRWRNLSPPPSL